MALERGAARQIQTVAELAEAIALYFEQPALRAAAGRAAYSLVTDNRGALEKTLAHMGEALVGAASSAPLDIAADARRL